MNKKLPQRLLEKQESERAATVAAVTDSINELESQGYDTRIKDIMLVTGLSRSVFAKPHIRKVLIEYGVVVPQDIESMLKDNNSRRDVTAILAEKDGYIQRLLFVIEQLTHEIELLSGEVHLLTHKYMLEDIDSF